MKRNYWAAILIAFFGGFIGLQEFYNGNMFLGILFLLFCWTGIPTIIAYIKILVWLFEGENSWNVRHGNSL